MSWALILLLQPCSMHEGKHEQNLTFNNPKNHEKKHLGWGSSLLKMTTMMVKSNRVTSWVAFQGCYNIIAPTQHKKVAWGTPQTSTKDEHELYKRWPWPKQKIKTNKKWWRMTSLFKMTMIVSCITLLSLHSGAHYCCYTLLLLYIATDYSCCTLHIDVHYCYYMLPSLHACNSSFHNTKSWEHKEHHKLNIKWL